MNHVFTVHQGIDLDTFLCVRSKEYAKDFVFVNNCAKHYKEEMAFADIIISKWVVSDISFLLHEVNVQSTSQVTRIFTTFI